jgi:hypothetical protein
LAPRSIPLVCKGFLPPRRSKVVRRPGDLAMPTAKIENDTRTWRADADRILGYWDEKLIADLEAGIVST